MLQVSIYDTNVWGWGRKHTFNTRRRKSPTANAFHDADSPIIQSDTSDLIRCSVWGIVVHKDHFPVDTLEGCFYCGNQHKNVFTFPESRDDDGHLNRPKRLEVVRLRHMASFDHRLSCGLKRGHERTSKYLEEAQCY